MRFPWHPQKPHVFVQVTQWRYLHISTIKCRTATEKLVANLTSWVLARSFLLENLLAFLAPFLNEVTALHTG